MTMTRKDFEAVADAIKRNAEPVKEQLGDAWGEVALTVSRRIAASVADALATTNPRFDRERFIAACGVQLEASAS